eukprot:gene69312-biopygen15067
MQAKNNNGSTALDIASSEPIQRLFQAHKEKKFLEAAKAERVDEVTALLNKGVNIQCSDQDGSTALHLAAAVYGNHATVTLLIERGADVEAKDKEKKLLESSKAGKVDEVAALLDQGVNIQCTDQNGSSALHEATIHGMVSSVAILLDKGADIYAKKTEKKFLEAVKAGRVEVVAAFLNQGVNIQCTDQLDEDGSTALHLAAAVCGNHATVTLLLESGADVEAKDKRGKTALDVTSSELTRRLLRDCIEMQRVKIEQEQQKIKDLEREKERAKEKKLFAAARTGRVEEVEALLDQGVNIQCIDQNGQLALHLAANCGHRTTVNFLLDRGANIAAIDNNGRTALEMSSSESTSRLLRDHIKMRIAKKSEPKQQKITEKERTKENKLLTAADAGKDDEVIILLEQGVNIQCTDQYGSTSLHQAANRGHCTTVTLLLDNGADIQAKGNEGLTALDITTSAPICTLLRVHKTGSTALHWAAGYGHAVTVTLLLDRGADIEAKDENGWTALHDAAGNGHAATVTLLLDRGADIEAKNEDGSTTLHDAAGNGHAATVTLLLDRGADIAAKDN